MNDADRGWADPSWTSKLPPATGAGAAPDTITRAEYRAEGTPPPEPGAATLDDDVHPVRPRVPKPIWYQFATCRGLDPAIFFPARGASHAEAQAVCSECPAQKACLEFAITHNERHGVWGKTSERERRRIRRARRLADTA